MLRPGALWPDDLPVESVLRGYGGRYFTLNDTVKGVLAGTGSTAANELGF